MIYDVYVDIYTREEEMMGFDLSGPAVILGDEYLMVSLNGVINSCKTWEELEVNLKYWEAHQITGWVYWLNGDQSTATLDEAP